MLTTQQLAENYSADSISILQNFNNNKPRYQEGKHYYLIQGEALKDFKRNLENFEVAKNVNKLYLWTEKGALLHAKSLNTDMAWDVYEYLVDFYFRAKEEQLPKQEPKQITEKYFPKFYDGEPIMPIRDFYEITGIDPKKQKFLFRQEYFRGGCDCNGLGWDLRMEFEKKYGVDYSEKETMVYMTISGLLKAIELFTIEGYVKDRLISLMPVPIPKRNAEIITPKPVNSNVTIAEGQYLISIKPFTNEDVAV